MTHKRPRESQHTRDYEDVLEPWRKLQPRYIKLKNYLAMVIILLVAAWLAVTVILFYCLMVQKTLDQCPAP